MNKLWIVLVGGLLFWFAAEPARAADHDTATVELATEVLRSFADLKVKSIPPAMLQDAQGVAIIPNVIKAGFVFGGRFGRGVVLAREPDGSWSNPVFLTLGGGGVGWQIGVQATDLVLVFKTRNGMDRILRGQSKLTLGADLSVAAGPLGRQAEAATDAQLRAEIFSYSRSRGLFAGVSLEGAGIVIDGAETRGFYGRPDARVADLMSQKALPIPLAAANLKNLLAQMSVPTPAAPMMAPPVGMQEPPLAAPLPPR